MLHEEGGHGDDDDEEEDGTTDSDPNLFLQREGKEACKRGIKHVC